jgi:hypothetical protein
MSGSSAPGCRRLRGDAGLQRPLSRHRLKGEIGGHYHFQQLFCSKKDEQNCKSVLLILLPESEILRKAYQKKKMSMTKAEEAYHLMRRNTRAFFLSPYIQIKADSGLYR